MPSASSRARRASPLVLAAVAALVVALVALGLSLDPRHRSDRC